MTQGILFLLAALVFVPIAVKLGLGSVLGYLVAGIVIGPVGFALVSDPAAILHVSELGVVLMLFVIGLELEPKRLWAMRAAVFGGGALKGMAHIGALKAIREAGMTPRLFAGSSIGATSAGGISSTASSRATCA